MTHLIRVVRCAMFAFAVAVCSAVPFHPTVAMPYRLLLESNADAGSGQEVFAVTFDTFEEFTNSPFDGGDGAFSGLDINTNFDIAAFTFDGQYRVILDQNRNLGRDPEIFAVTFDTFEEFINSPFNGGDGAFSSIDINPNFKIVGLAYDGQYRLVFETTTDVFNQPEVFVATFDTFEDFINATDDFDGEFSGIDINNSFDIVGFTFDGQYRLILESNANENGGQEVFSTTFDTFEDLINSPFNGGDGAFSGIDINSGFDAVGFAAEFPLRETQVSEPGMLFLFGLGLLSIVVVRRRL